jgi:hypothetical protein
MLNIDIWARLMGKKFGQFGLNWSKMVKRLEIFSQPRDSNIISEFPL